MTDTPMTVERREAYATAYRIVATYSNMEPEDAGPLIDAITNELVSRDAFFAESAKNPAPDGVEDDLKWVKGENLEQAADKTGVFVRLSTRGREAGAAAVPEGWKLVPVEPTPKMIADSAPLAAHAPGEADYVLALEAVKLLPTNEHPDIADVLAQMAVDYRAMLAAAPTATEEK